MTFVGRPVSREEFQAGMAGYCNRGCPLSDETKEQVAIRIDHKISVAYRAEGPGGQERRLFRIQ